MAAPRATGPALKSVDGTPASKVVPLVRVPDVVNRQDVRMRDGRDGFGFPLEALAQQRVASERRRENLDDNSAIEAAVAHPIDFAHAARPDRRHDFVRTEPCAWRNRHVGEARL
jgi:hypothetical protein